MSIRLRMTLWYSAILCVTLIVFSAGIYTLFASNEQREIESSLASRVSAVLPLSRAMLRSDEISQIGRQVGSLPIPGLPPPGERTVGGRSTLGAPDLYIQLANKDGQIVGRSANLINSDTSLPVPHGSINRPAFARVTLAGQDFQMLVQPVTIGGEYGGVLEMARPLSEAERMLSRLRFILAFGVVAAVIVAAATGWALASAALRPIARIGHSAFEIGETQDFGRRVAYQGPRDEVGQLAETMNAMLSRLESAYGRVQAALEAQRRFVADASHELRTPLTTIRGNIELLALSDEGESLERQEALRDIASEAERMSRLVADLLTLARADAGLRIERKPLALRPLVEEVYRQTRRIAGDVRLELGDVPDVAVSGSPDHLKQLLFILLDNALKYSPPGGLVRIQGDRTDGRIRLSVADTGSGIAPEDLEHIFERFYRLDPSRHGEGAGLGLSIARWIVDEHGGQLTVESTKGLGSTFSVLLPIVPMNAVSAPEQAALPAGR